MTKILQFKEALTSKLVSSTVLQSLQHWTGTIPVTEFLSAEIDPEHAGGADFCKQYGIPISEGANCIIVEASRADTLTLAACLVPVNCSRTDFNGIVRKELNARRVSVAPLDEVLRMTQMEYGSITVIGLPESWPILIDSSFVSVQRLVIGSGLKKSKLSLPGSALTELPNVKILNGLCIAC